MKNKSKLKSIFSVIKWPDSLMHDLRQFAVLSIVLVFFTALFIDYKSKTNAEFLYAVSSIKSMNWGNISLVRDIIKEEGWETLDDEERIRGAVKWIQTHVRYETDTYDKKDGYTVVETLTGDCAGQAHLFYLFMREMGIECHILRLWQSPIYKDDEQKLQTVLNEPTHAANTVQLGETIYLVDCTSRLQPIMSPQEFYELELCKLIPFEYEDELYATHFTLSDHWMEKLGFEKIPVY